MREILPALLSSCLLTSAIMLGYFISRQFLGFATPWRIFVLLFIFFAFLEYCFNKYD